MMYTWKKEHAGVTRFLASSVFAIDCAGRIYTLAYVNTKDGYKFKPIAGACKDKTLYVPNFTTQEAAIDAALKDDYTVYEFGNEDEFYAWLGQRYAATVPPAADVPAVMNAQTYDSDQNIYAIVSLATHEVQVLTITPDTGKFMFFPTNGRQTRPRLFDTRHECIEDATADGLRVYEFKSDIEYYGWLGKLYAVPVLPFNGVVPRPADSERINILEERVSQLQNFWSLRYSDMLKKIEESNSKSTVSKVSREELADGYYIVSHPLAFDKRMIAQRRNKQWLTIGAEEPYSGYLTVHSKVDIGA